jgi:hypothetical protein
MLAIMHGGQIEEMMNTQKRCGMKRLLRRLLTFDMAPAVIVLHTWAPIVSLIRLRVTSTWVLTMLSYQNTPALLQGLKFAGEPDEAHQLPRVDFKLVSRCGCAILYIRRLRQFFIKGAAYMEQHGLISCIRMMSKICTVNIILSLSAPQVLDDWLKGKPHNDFYSTRTTRTPCASTMALPPCPCVMRCPTSCIWAGEASVTVTSGRTVRAGHVFLAYIVLDYITQMIKWTQGLVDQLDRYRPPAKGIPPPMFPNNHHHKAICGRGNALANRVRPLTAALSSRIMCHQDSTT